MDYFPYFYLNSFVIGRKIPIARMPLRKRFNLKIAIVVSCFALFCLHDKHLSNQLNCLKHFVWLFTHVVVMIRWASIRHPWVILAFACRVFPPLRPLFSSLLESAHRKLWHEWVLRLCHIHWFLAIGPHILSWFFGRHGQHWCGMQHQEESKDQS